MRAQHGVGHGVEAKQPSWARRRACPRKRASLSPPSAPRQPKQAPKGQAAGQRYALIDKRLAQPTLASIPIHRTLSQPERQLAPSKRAFSPPPTKIPPGRRGKPTHRRVTINGQPSPSVRSNTNFYGYCNGIYSSRRLAKACRERVDFM